MNSDKICYKIGDVLILKHSSGYEYQNYIRVARIKEIGKHGVCGIVFDGGGSSLGYGERVNFSANHLNEHYLIDRGYMLRGLIDEL